MALLEKYQNQINEQDMKTEIQEIVRSYRHSWDIYSELIQNAVDAINRKYKILNDPEYYFYENFREEYGHLDPDPDFRGKLIVKWDADNQILTIQDNGVGMESKYIETYLLPKGSGKKVGKDYGFKGYGFTFASFVSQLVRINSRHLSESETMEICYEGCFDWLANGNKFPTGPTPEPIVSSSPIEDTSGTIIRIKLSENYADLFPAIASLDDAVNFIQNKDDINKLEYILRTRTAIGNTRYLFGKEPSVPIDITLIVILNGEEIEKEIRYNFQHPKEHKEVSVLSYDLVEYVQNLTGTAFQRDFRALFHSVEDLEVGTIKKVKFDVALCAISQTRLNNIESELEIPSGSDYELTYGIHLAINGMPTGIRIDDWETRGGYLKRYYVIVDTDLSMSEQLDSGRKGISKHFANLISNEVIKLLTTSKIQIADGGYSASIGHFALTHLDTGRVTGGDMENDDFQTILRKIALDKKEYSSEDLETLDKIMSISSLSRIPKTEQEVIVLFYHLLEKGIIKGYRTEYISGVATYDAALSYKIKLEEKNDSRHDVLGIAPAILDSELSKGREFYDLANFRRDASSDLCVEFKLSLSGFLREIQGKTEKDPDCIDILICWDEQIPPNIPKSSYTLGEVHDNQRKFHGTTHRLGVIGPEKNTEIFCIMLKSVLEKL